MFIPDKKALDVFSYGESKNGDCKDLLLDTQYGKISHTIENNMLKIAQTNNSSYNNLDNIKAVEQIGDIITDTTLKNICINMVDYSGGNGKPFYVLLSSSNVKLIGKTLNTGLNIIDISSITVPFKLCIAGNYSWEKGGSQTIIIKEIYCSN